MGLIWTGEHKGRHLYGDGNDGHDYKIEIYDHLASGTSRTFTLQGEGYRIQVEGGSRDFFVKLKPKTCEWTMIINTSELESFIDDISDSAPKRYSVKAYRDGAIKFIGWILTDQIMIEDMSMPYTFTLKAHCGLSTLDEYEYKDIDDTPLDGKRYLIDHVRQVLETTYIDELYLDAERILAIAIPYFETNFVTTQCTLSQTVVDHRAYTTYEEIKYAEWLEFDDGIHIPVRIPVLKTKIEAVDFVSCKEVIEDICQSFFSEMYQEDGVYHIIGKANYIANGYDIYYYTKAGGLTYTTKTSFNNIDRIDTIKKRGGKWTFLQPLKKLIIDQRLEIQRNIISGLTWDWLQNEEVADVLYLYATGDTRLSISIGLDILSVDANSNPPIQHWYLFDVKIQVGVWYLERDWLAFDDIGDPTYDETTWSSDTSAVYQILAYIDDPIAKIGSLKYVTQFETAAIPADGSLTVDINLNSIVRPNLTTLPLDGIFTEPFFNTNYDYDVDWTWKSYNNAIRVLSDNEDINEDARVFLRYENVLNLRSNETLKLSFRLGDDPGTTNVNRLQRSVVSFIEPFADTTAWTKVGIPTEKTLIQHVIDDMSSFRNKLVRIMRADILTTNASIEISTRLNYDSHAYIYFSGTTNTELETISGEWIEIIEEASGITKKDPKRYTGLQHIPLLNDIVNAGSPPGDGGGGGDGGTTPTPLQYAEFTGADLVALKYTNPDMYFPDPAVTSHKQIHAQWSVMRNLVEMEHVDTIVHPTQYKIDPDDEHSLIFMKAVAGDKYRVRKRK